eukprot:CAMPEP_0118865920 /NCGR_PEP_ID=MMETSP1163-20130328/10017_1 /TAXON_ID=124430 /ORGANISM="Phaeomonas parva, Strain CCMP2877" /LENGTH=979 /DNA_ID=CAMNT_0006800189 /DNA_START=228 /DNA_END=3170 /DNA_ORIENTATION=-
MRMSQIRKRRSPRATPKKGFGNRKRDAFKPLPPPKPRAPSPEDPHSIAALLRNGDSGMMNSQFGGAHGKDYPMYHAVKKGKNSMQVHLRTLADGAEGIVYKAPSRNTQVVTDMLKIATAAGQVERLGGHIGRQTRMKIMKPMAYDVRTTGKRDSNAEREEMARNEEEQCQVDCFWGLDLEAQVQAESSAAMAMEDNLALIVRENEKLAAKIQMFEDMNEEEQKRARRLRDKSEQRARKKYLKAFLKAEYTDDIIEYVWPSTVNALRDESTIDSLESSYNLNSTGSSRGSADAEEEEGDASHKATGSTILGRFGVLKHKPLPARRAEGIFDPVVFEELGTYDKTAMRIPDFRLLSRNPDLNAGLLDVVQKPELPMEEDLQVDLKQVMRATTAGPGSRRPIDMNRASEETTTRKEKARPETRKTETAGKAKRVSRHGRVPRSRKGYEEERKKIYLYNPEKDLVLSTSDRLSTLNLSASRPSTRGRPEVDEPAAAAPPAPEVAQAEAADAGSGAEETTPAAAKFAFEETELRHALRCGSGGDNWMVLEQRRSVDEDLYVTMGSLGGHIIWDQDHSAALVELMAAVEEEVGGCAGPKEIVECLQGGAKSVLEPAAKTLLWPFVKRGELEGLIGLLTPGPAPEQAAAAEPKPSRRSSRSKSPGRKGNKKSARKGKAKAKRNGGAKGEALEKEGPAPAPKPLVLSVPELLTQYASAFCYPPLLKRGSLRRFFKVTASAQGPGTIGEYDASRFNPLEMVPVDATWRDGFPEFNKGEVVLANPPRSSMWFPAEVTAVQRLRTAVEEIVTYQVRFLALPRNLLNVVERADAERGQGHLMASFGAGADDESLGSLGSADTDPLAPNILEQLYSRKRQDHYAATLFGMLLDARREALAEDRLDGDELSVLHADEILVDLAELAFRASEPMYPVVQQSAGLAMLLGKDGAPLKESLRRLCAESGRGGLTKDEFVEFADALDDLARWNEWTP